MDNLEPSCLCGHFDDCPACHEPGYDRHKVIEHLKDMNDEARRALVDELAAAARDGATLRSEIRRSGYPDVVTVIFTADRANGPKSTTANRSKHWTAPMVETARITTAIQLRAGGLPPHLADTIAAKACRTAQAAFDTLPPLEDFKKEDVSCVIMATEILELLAEAGIESCGLKTRNDSATGQDD